MSDKEPRILAILPEVEDDFPPKLKEAIVRRKLVALTGECVCGAKPQPTLRQHSATIFEALVIHNDQCPAPHAEELLRKWHKKRKR